MAHQENRQDSFKFSYEAEHDQDETDNKTYTVDSMDEGNKDEASISGAERDMISADDGKNDGYSMLWDEGIAGSVSGRSNSTANGVVNTSSTPKDRESIHNPFHSVSSQASLNGRTGNVATSNSSRDGDREGLSMKEKVHRYSSIPSSNQAPSTQSQSIPNESKRLILAALSHDYTFNKVPSRTSSASSNSPGYVSRRGSGNSRISTVHEEEDAIERAANRTVQQSEKPIPQAPLRRSTNSTQHMSVSPAQRRMSVESTNREMEAEVASIPSTTCRVSNSIRPDDNRNAVAMSEKTSETTDHKQKKLLDGLGTPVYQIEVRFIVYKGLRFCGGVRVLLNCAEESAYLQLITLQDEVFVTYDINNICFLEPRSAAGVSFCGVPYNPPKMNHDRDDNPETDISATEATDGIMERKRQRCREKKARMSVIDHAEVVFCTPEQTMRFKTVIDTLLCAVACEDSNCPPPSLTDIGGAVPAPVQERTEGVPFGDSSGSKRTQYTNQPAIIYPQSVKQHEPVAEQYGSMVKAKYGMVQSFDPCPRGPVSTSMCLPCDLGDPYQLNPDEGRVVFCTPACLKVCCRNGEKMVYKGKLKIVQGTGGIGFVIRIESTDGTTLYCHSLRRDLILYETNDVQYGFCYSTVVCTAGRTSMETFVVAFPSSYQCDQFKHAINTCKEILGMTSVQSLINVNRT